MEPNTNKFSELSPVLELIYVMLSNMAKYLKVYANDIDAEKEVQYQEAKEALDNAIKKFDVLYGLQSEVVDAKEEETEADETVDTNVAPTTSTRSDSYDFASGADPESLKKAKETVQELKSLFADMKDKEKTEVAPPVSSPAEMPKPMVEAPPVVPPVLPPLPTEVSVPSVSSIPSGEVAPAPVQAESTPVVAPAPVTEMPSPMSTPVEQKPAAPKQDAAEIDTILAELRKLQNKGNSEL